MIHRWGNLIFVVFVCFFFFLKKDPQRNLCEFIQFPWDEKEFYLFIFGVKFVFASCLPSLFRPCVCVAIFSQLAKGDIFAPDLAPAALGGEKQSQSGRRTHKKGPAARAAIMEKAAASFQTALCVWGRTALARLSLSYISSNFFSFNQFSFSSFSLSLHSPTIFLSFVFFSLCVCNFRCQ